MTTPYYQPVDFYLSADNQIRFTLNLTDTERAVAVRIAQAVADNQVDYGPTMEVN